MSLIVWHTFSGCCDGNLYQVQVSTPSPYTIGLTYALETEVYTGCYELVSTGFTSGAVVVSIYSSDTTSYSSCTACTSIYTCAPLTPTPTNTLTPTNTATPNPTVTQTRAPFLTPTRTSQPTGTPFSTVTPTKTPYVTRTPTRTPIGTLPPNPPLTQSVTPTNTETPTNTPTNTSTPTITPSPEITPSNTPSNTPTKTPLPSFGITQNVTPTQTSTPTNTPTVTSSTACTQNSYCLFTGYSGTSNYDGVYYNYGIHNGYSLFYSPESVAQGVIYYNTGQTRWCISSVPDGTCVIFGPSPSNTLCPDLNSSLFSSVCPTPTPSQSAGCETFSFSAIFDCVSTATTQTPTVTSTQTKTPTNTPSPTNNCSSKSITVSASTFNYFALTPTPSTTPTDDSQNCLVTGNTEFKIFQSSFVSGLNKILVNCSSGVNYIVSNTIPFNTGATFNAVIDGVGVCVTYLSDFFGAPINILEEIQSGNLLECSNCVPIPSQTQTPTNTPTPTLTPTISLTPSLTPCLQTGIDFTFVNSGGLKPNNSPEKIVKLSDGNFIVVGSFTGYNSTNVSGIVKINTNGVIDPTFTISSGFSSVSYSQYSPFDVVEQSDGKIVCGGVFEFYSGVPRNSVCRLNSDGTLDSSYVVGSGFNGPVLRIGIQSDNKVVFVGDFTSYDGNPVGYICRLNTDGSFDSSFGAYIGFDAYPSDLQILLDDSIIVGGYFTTYNSVYLAPYIIKLDSNGNVDTSFTPGTGFDGPVLTTYVDSEQNIYASGNFNNYSIYGSSNGLIKLDLSATPYSDFTLNIGSSFSTGYAIYIQETLDNNLILSLYSGSTFNGYANGGIVKISKSGVYDSQFYAYPGFNNTVVDITIDNNNKIICIGNFETFNGTLMNGIVKLQPCQYNLPSQTPSNTPTQTPTQTPTVNCPLIQNSMLTTATPYFLNIDSTNGIKIITEVFLGYEGRVSMYSSGNTLIYQYTVDYDVQPTYINEDYDYIFIPIYNENKVYVYSTNYLTPLYELTGFNGPNSVAFDTKNNRTYILNSEDDTISIFNSGTLSFIGLIGVTDNYLGNMVYDSVNEKMIVTGNRNYVISAIDVDTYTSTFLDVYLEFNDTPILFCTGDSRVYTTMSSINSIIVWDFSINSQYNFIDLSAYGQITNINIDESRYYLYVGIAPNTLLTYDLSFNIIQNTEVYSEITQLVEVKYNQLEDKIYLVDQGSNSVKVVCPITYPTTPLPTPDPTLTPTPNITPSNTLTPFPTPTRTPDVTLTVTPSITPTNTVTPSVTPSNTPPASCPYSINTIVVPNSSISFTNDNYNNYVWVIDKFSGNSYDSSYNLVSTVGTWAAAPYGSTFDSVNNRVYVAVGSNIDSIDVTTSTLTPSLFSFSGTIYSLSIINTLLAIADNSNSGVDIYDVGVGLWGTVYTTTPPTKLVWDNSGYIYVIDSGTELYIISWSTLSIVSTLTIGASSNVELLFIPYNNYLYILELDVALWYIDTSTFTVAGSISLTGYTSTYGLTYDSTMNYIYIGVQAADLLIIDVTSNNLINFKQNLRIPAGTTSILNFNSYTNTTWWSDDSSTSIDILCNSASTPIPTPSPTTTNTSTPTQTSTVALTQTPTVTSTPTNTPTNTMTPTNTNTPNTTPTATNVCPLVLSNNVLPSSVVISDFGDNSNMETDSYNSYIWLGMVSSPNLRIHDSGGTYVTGFTITPNTLTYDGDDNKMFISSGSTTIVFDVTTLTSATTINHTGVTEAVSSTYDSNTGKLGILDIYIDKVAIIDGSSNVLDGYINLPLSCGLSIGYKGIIQSDTNNGIMYIASSFIICPSGTLCACTGLIYSVNPSTLTTGGTVNFSGYPITNGVTSMKFNPTNGYMYVLEPGKKVVYFDTSTNTIQGSISISGYSGVNESMIYNIDKNYLYVSNRQSPSVQGIIVIDCSTNTVINFKNSVALSTGIVGLEYDSPSARLFHTTSNNNRLRVFCT